jgi:uncharacterized membrane protein (UPF0127 family)
VTYRSSVRLGKPLAGLAAITAVVAASLTQGGVAQPSVTAKLALDGVTFRPELALTSDQRAIGLMHRRKAPADGMLFVFPSATTGGFWMKNTLVPLAIVFFDSRGKRVSRLSMKPCRRDPCRIYSPSRSYRYALELPATDKRPALRLGPRAALSRLTRSAA